MNGAFGDLADDRIDRFGRDAARGEADGAIDIGMGHGAAGEGLEGERLGDPYAAELPGQLRVVPVARMGEAVEETVRPLEDRARPTKALAGEQRGTQARLRRPAGMQPLRPGSVREIFDDAARHAAGDAERVDELRRVEAKRRAARSRGGDGAEDAGRMRPG